MALPASVQGEKERENSDDDTDTASSHYYYFAYGPVVNDLVRKRRGIVVSKIQAAYLPDYRLTFQIGGLANIVPRRGYEVHGLLMQLQSLDDWNRIIAFDAGSAPSWHTVVPYNSSCGNGLDGEDPIQARFVEFSGKAKLDDEFLDGPIADESLPRCRYLELIAAGMRAYQVDEDYIQDQILAIPFVPKRRPDEYEQIPLDTEYLRLQGVPSLSTTKSSRSILQEVKRRISRKPSNSTITQKQKLPQISFQQYLKLCAEGKPGGDVYFILGKEMVRIQHQPDMVQAAPAAKWCYVNGHGKPDLALLLHKLVVDVNLELCDHLNQMTPLHYAWAENHLVEQLIDTYQCTVTKIAIVIVTEMVPIIDTDTDIDIDPPEQGLVVDNNSNANGGKNKSGTTTVLSSPSVFLRSVKRSSNRFSMTKKK